MEKSTLTDRNDNEQYTIKNQLKNVNSKHKDRNMDCGNKGYGG